MPEPKLTPAAARKKLLAIYRAHDEWQSDVLGAFDKAVETISLKAVSALVRVLTQSLTFDKRGVVEHTPRNLRILGRLDKSFREQLDQYGYKKVVASFLSEFPAQLQPLGDILSTIGRSLVTPFVYPKALLTAPEQRMLRTKQTMAGHNLLDLAVTLGKSAKRQALLSVGGLSRASLTDTISEQLGKMRGESATLAATSLSIWYRTADKQVLAKLDLSSQQRFFYDGPEDKLNRAFCAAMCKKRDRGLTWTRKQIDAMDNGQLPDTFSTCGGYNCRHQFRLALPDETAQA